MTWWKNAAAAMAALLLAGCGSMSYFPPQNLGEVKRGPGDLRNAKVVVSLAPQMQLDRPRTEAKLGYYHDVLVAKIAGQLTARGAKVSTEVRNLNDLAGPRLSDVVAQQRADYVMIVRQERMSTINSQPAGLVWLVQLGAPGAPPVFETHYSVAGAYCLGVRVLEFAEPTAMQCLEKQAEFIASRLEANGFFTGDPGPARPLATGANWSEPPTKQSDRPKGSSACLLNAPGVRCN